MLRSDLISEALDTHVAWLRQFGQQRAKSFHERRQADIEAAGCEALIAEYLRPRVESIEPAEDPSFGGPDFRCVKNGQSFYVEVTSLKRKAVEKAIFIPDDSTWEGGPVGSISSLVRTAVCGKFAQCLRSDAPTLVAIGSHHSWLNVDHSLVEELLISDVAYEVHISREQPLSRRPGRFVTRLRNSLFRRIGSDGVQNAREYVAGVVIFGLGYLPIRAIGVINDKATCVFDPRLLPDIDFATTEDVDGGGIAVHWMHTDR